MPWWGWLIAMIVATWTTIGLLCFFAVMKTAKSIQKDADDFDSRWPNL